MKHMRLALVVSTFPPYRGGMGNAAAVQARLLAARGYEVTVFTPAYGQESSDEAAPYRVVRLKPLIKFGNAAFIPQVLKRVATFDLIFLHYPFFGAQEILLASTAPVVLYYHMDAIGKGIFNILFTLHRWLLLSFILKKARKIFVSSAAYAETSFLTRAPERIQSRIVAMPYSVDTRRFTPAPRPTDLARQYDLQESAPVALFVGSLDSAHYFKGIPQLLAAWHDVVKALPSARLFIVGKGNAASSYKAQARTLHIADKVTFVPDVSEARLPRYYQLADLHVLPSTDRSEAFGLVTLEAMASGRPSVVSRLPGVADLVTEKESGWVAEPGATAELIWVLTRALSDPAELRRRGNRGRELALSKYSEAICGDRLAAALRSAAIL